MKITIFRIGAFVVLITSLLILTWKIVPQTNSTLINESKLREHDEVVKIVKSFWQISLEGNEKNLNELITNTPQAFLSSCQSQKEPINQVNNSSFPVGQGIGISENFIEQNRVYLKMMSKKIKADSYKIFDIVETLQEENEALVRVQYGTGESPYYQDIFLLYKENNKWHIFMFTNKTELDRYNKDFAQKSKCQ